MGGFYRPNEYIKRNWDKSLYRPKRMANSASSVNQELNTTCNNLRELAEAIKNVANAANSSYYSSHANSLINQIGTMNSNLSRTAKGATEDLVNVCNIIASKNKNLASSMKNVQRQLVDDLSVVEKFYNDGR